MEKLRMIFGKQESDQSSERELTLVAYLEILEAIHAGQEPDPDEASIVFERAGKSESDVKEDLKRIKVRHEYEAAIAKGKLATRKFNEIEAKIARFEQQHGEKMKPLYEQRQELFREIDRGNVAAGYIKTNFATVKL